MADTDAVRGAGLPDRLAAVPSPTSPGQPTAEPEKVMTLVDHLTELRTRIVRSILAVVPGSAIGFAVAPVVKQFLVAPLPASALPLQVLGPGDAFGIQLRIAVVVGVILAMPVLLYQLWAFVAPGLTPTERRALRPWIPLALFFFVLGVTIAYAILPFAIGFLLAFTDNVIVAHLAAPPYFDFVTTMFLAFGLLMEFPIVLYALARVGILSSARLRSSRRMVILGIAIFAAVATPGGDLVSPTILGGTMYILFELTLIAIRRGGR
ncbi:MAG TPA: twin-arginine translocase subunit TatC [Candidatus Deferrimicrobium sp.]|nr:twin-arginine translocase subunit TatC [Candidatus Deferrimicrobium sp.]